MEYEFRGPGVQNKPQTRRERRPDRPTQRPSRPAGGRSGSRSLVQLFAAVVGAVFLLVGILGFIPGVTSNYDELNLIGPDSQAELLGLFEVSVLHNIVHLAFGVAGLLAAARASASVGFLVGGGVLYAVVFVYGILIEQNSDLDILPVNDADNILHLALAIGMIALGLMGAALLKRTRT